MFLVHHLGSRKLSLESSVWYGELRSAYVRGEKKQSERGCKWGYVNRKKAKKVEKAWKLFRGIDFFI